MTVCAGLFKVVAGVTAAWFLVLLFARTSCSAQHRVDAGDVHAEVPRRLLRPQLLRLPSLGLRLQLSAPLSRPTKNHRVYAPEPASVAVCSSTSL